METNVKAGSRIVEIEAVIRDKDGNIKDTETIQISLEDILKQLLQELQKGKEVKK